MSLHRTPSRAALRLASFQLWLFLVAVATLVGSLWLELPPDLSPWARLYVPLALVSSVAALALVPGAAFFALACFVRSWRWVGRLQAGIGALFLVLLYADTVIYRLLGYHMNSAVLNVLTTPGSEYSVQLGWRVWTLASCVLAGGTWVALQVWHASLARSSRREAEGLAVAGGLLRPRVVFLVFLIPTLFVERGVNAAADILHEREVTSACRPIPWVTELSWSRLFDPDAGPPRMDVRPEDARLAWPARMPRLDPGGPRPSLLLLVIDSWRRDAFSDRVTPRLAEFARGARVFEDHISGGNGTRFGVFSMLYGLHGPYWQAVLRERRRPVLLDVLEGQGYETRVFSSASMDFPEFNETAWVGMRDRVADRFRAPTSNERDVQLAGAFELWLHRRPRDQPFFCFVLLDSPHQPYGSPGGPFRPESEGYDYLRLATGADPATVERVQNRYKNAVHHADRVAGRLLDSLAASGHDERTVVLVTGDHGEEFNEFGYWGHTSNFAPLQLEVPFLLRGPGVEPGRETRPTSHLDVSNSLLELLGADRAERADYSLGQSLFDPPAERRRVVAGWSDVGMLTASGIFRVELTRNGSEVEVYDRRWRPLYDVEARCNLEAAGLERLARECVRFFASP